uniref:Uncharacterized protein n=1 Tax=Arundo donax TaxID=35708 RepID=A0A0A8Z237_ARUDO
MATGRSSSPAAAGYGGQHLGAAPHSGLQGAAAETWGRLFLTPGCRGRRPKLGGASSSQPDAGGGGHRRHRRPAKGAQAGWQPPPDPVGEDTPTVTGARRAGEGSAGRADQDGGRQAVARAGG